MEAFLTWLGHSLVKPIFWFQPCFYALHGWLATEMAIWMLFHPYEAKFIPGTRLQIPLTPGILPRGRANLSQSIADTVTRNLLTETDIHKQAARLITEENLERCIEALLDSVERELQSKEQIRRIYRYGDEVLPELLTRLISSGIQNLEEDKHGKLRQLLVQVLEQGMQNLHCSYVQAEFLTDILFNTLLTPAYIRQMVVAGLTEENIQRIEAGLSEQIGGVRGFLVQFMGVSDALVRLRDFFESHPAEAETQISEILDRFEIRERLAERISGFSFAELSVETQGILVNYLTTLLIGMLGDYRGNISQTVSQWGGAASRLLINRLLHTNLKTWLNEERPDIKRKFAQFLNRYLHRELELMVRRILPGFNLEQMIVEKLGQFSNQQLETLVYGICRRELKWLAFLGAFLGFWLGLLSNLIHYWLQP